MARSAQNHGESADRSVLIRVAATARPLRLAWALAWVLAGSMGVGPRGFAQARFWRDDAIGRAAGPAPILLTNLAQLRGLDRLEAKLGIPVRLQGVVTYREDQWPALFIQDGQCAAFVFRPKDAPLVNAGEVVEIQGQSRDGFAPAIQAEVLRPLGRAELPAPVVTTMEELATGRHDGLRVRVITTVRWMHLTYRRLHLHVGEASGRFEIHVPEFPGPLPVELVGARVELTGVTGTKLDARGNVIGAGVSVPRLEEIRILTPSPADPWERPAQVINTLMYFHPSTSFGQRTKVRGVVTLNTPSGRIFVEDASGGCEVRLPSFQVRPDRNGQYLDPPRPPDLRVGDAVEVLAYPDIGSYAPILTDAIVRRIGASNLPSAEFLLATNVLGLPLDSRRIRLAGRVVAAEVSAGKSGVQQRLTINNDNVVFFAEFEGDRPLAVPVESRVELTGIVAFEADARRRITGFHMLVPTPEDVRVLAGPPMITTHRLVGIGAPAAGLTLGWVWLLRRQVRRRTKELRNANDELRRAEAELRQSLAQEREVGEMKGRFVSLVSHEFRTPLGVIVSSTDILRRYFDRLDAGMRADQLDIIQRSTGTLSGLIEDLLLLGKTEAGRLACHPVPLDVLTLCRHVADEVGSATQRACPIRIEVEGDLAGARADEALLRPALTNLLTNAVKYSPAGSPILLRATRRDTHAELVIRDHGIGIPAADQPRLFTAFVRAGNVGHRPGTGLGLVIAKRCAELHGGRIELESAVGEGTTFTLTLPLFGVPATATPPPADARS